MKNILKEIENIQIKENIPVFKSGDTISVNFNIIDNKYKITGLITVEKLEEIIYANETISQ